MSRPWYLRAFVAISAWFTASFFLFWIGLALKMSEAPMMILGFALVAGASIVARANPDSDFIEQACLACSISGRGAAFVGLAGLLNSHSVAAGVLLLAEPLWFFIDPRFVSRFVSSLAGFSFFGTLAFELSKRNGFNIIVALAGALTLWCWLFAWQKDDERWKAVWGPLGWASVLQLLLGALVASALHGERGFRQDIFWLGPWLAVLLAVLQFKLWQGDGRVLGISLLVLGLLAYFMRQNPDVIAALMVALLAFHLRQAGLLRLAGLALLSALIGYYYRRQETLLVKAGLLAGAGAVLGLGALLLARFAPEKKKAAKFSLEGPGKKALAGALLVLVMLGVNFKAFRAEEAKADGQTVYLRLAPVDPRDILLGDHMVLRFEVETHIGLACKRAPELAANGKAWMRMDKGGILNFADLDNGRPKEGFHRMNYSYKGQQASLGIAKAYFQEGDEPRFRNARFGRCKLLPDGSLAWLGFAGEGLEEL